MLGIIALLIAVLLPAVQMAREAARRASCQNKLRQIGLGLNSYQSLHTVFPPRQTFGQPFGGGLPGGPWNEKVMLLPHVGESDLYNSINLGLPWIDDANATIAILSPERYLCPSDANPRGGRDERAGVASYQACTGSGSSPLGLDGVVPNPMTEDYILAADGLFATITGLGPKDVKDGLSHTAAMSEMVHGAQIDLDQWPSLPIPTLGIQYGFDVTPPTQRNVIEKCENLTLPYVMPFRSGMPWFSDASYTHLFTPGKASCLSSVGGYYSPITASSRHRGGVNVLFADGHVRFTENSVDATLWQALGSRNGREQVDF